ncbi:MAG: M28 family peptidase [Bacteroidales bacterium]|nr:M28 family peptidase [Bacteroidales bacterium]
MNKSRAILPFLAAAMLLLVLPLRAQSYRTYENMVSVEWQEEVLSVLAHDMTEGRASGTRGKELAEHFLVEQFRALGLKPWQWNYTQSVKYQDSIVVRNVVGLVPAVVPTDEYIVIGAHYDHLGLLGHSVYPGADDNASGVTALLSIAKMCCALRADGRGPRKNLIFVCFDGKELDMAGSRHFVRTLPFPRSRITAMVNLDMLGTDLVPPRRNPEYLFAIGENTLPETYQGYLAYITTRTLYKMDLDLTFYGSRDFSRMMYQTSDQHPFARAGIPAVLFTSAFHQHTYKKTDTPDIINYHLLRKRTMVIFNFILRLCSDN